MNHAVVEWMLNDYHRLPLRYITGHTPGLSFIRRHIDTSFNRIMINCRLKLHERLIQQKFHSYIHRYRERKKFVLESCRKTRFHFLGQTGRMQCQQELLEISTA